MYTARTVQRCTDGFLRKGIPQGFVPVVVLESCATTKIKARRSNQDVETILWLLLAPLRVGGFEDLNKFGFSTWDLQQEGLRHRTTKHKVALTNSILWPQGGVQINNTSFLLTSLGVSRTQIFLLTLRYRISLLKSLQVYQLLHICWVANDMFRHPGCFSAEIVFIGILQRKRETQKAVCTWDVQVYEGVPYIYMDMHMHMYMYMYIYIYVHMHVYM